MASVVTEHSRKRTRPEEVESNRAKRTPFASTRQQFANPQSFLPSTPKATFLRLHLQILKSLYVPDDALNDNNNNNLGEKISDLKEDGQVQQDVFGAIEQFVQQRRQLTGLVHAVKLNKAVHEEAANCLINDDPVLLVDDKDYAPTPMAVPSNDGIFGRGNGNVISSQPSPFGQSLFSGGVYRPGMSQSSRQSSGPDLLAALLKRKFLIADRTLRKKTHVFQELLGSVKERIGTIEELLAKQKEAPGLQSPEEAEKTTKDDSLLENEYRLEMIAKLETKRQLWAMLLKDMEAAYDL